MCPAGTQLAQAWDVVQQRSTGDLSQDLCQLWTKDSTVKDFFLQNVFCQSFSSDSPSAPGHGWTRPRAQLAVKPPRVAHVRQLFNWDCGLACVLMVLKAAAPRAVGLDLPALRQWCPTTSIWTIDLAHLLRRFGVQVVMTTLTLGANEAYSGEEYYAESIAEDEARVQKLFNDAPLSGIPVHQRSLSAWELQEALASGRYLAIALVDKALLGGPWAWRHTEVAGNVAYTGHYIVVCGYSAATDSYAIRDPAAEVEDLTLSSAAFEAARRAFGTDEDLLLVGTPAPGGGLAPPGIDFARAAAFAAAL